MTFGKLLAALLDEKGITAGELARRIGTNRSSIYSLMNGKAKEPTLKRAKEIADALGVTLDELAERMDDE